MDSLSYKTISTSKETSGKTWILVDAENQALGRLASNVARVLRGKHKTNFTPHADCGDNVVVVNSDKIKLSGNKFNDKEYIRYTGYPGGQRVASPTLMMEKDPARMVEKAVKGMLPKTRLGNAIFGNLFVYAGTEHPHEAQKPTQLKF